MLDLAFYLDDGVHAQLVGRVARAHAKIVLDVEYGLALGEEGVLVHLLYSEQPGRRDAPIRTGQGEEMHQIRNGTRTGDSPIRTRDARERAGANITNRHVDRCRITT